MAEGDTEEEAITKAVSTGKEYVVNAVTNDRPLSINRSLPGDGQTANGNDTYAYFMLSGYNTQDTAQALAIMKNNPDVYKSLTAGLLQEMGLPPEASNPDFVGSDAWNELINNNQYYDEALTNYQSSYLTFKADSVVNSYEKLLQQVPQTDTDTKNYLEYQLELLKENPDYLYHLSTEKLDKTSNLTTQEASDIYDKIYNTPAYLSFMASWSSGTSVYTPLSEFTSGDIPSWFSVGDQSIYTSYKDKLPNEIENENLQKTLTLTQQLGVYDFTMDTLGADGNKMFNNDYTYQKYNFQDIQKVYNDMLGWNNLGEGDLEQSIDDYRLTGQDGMLLQNMYHTYKDQNIIEKVSSPNSGSYNVLLNKIKLALNHPELPFNILNMKDETGNSISTTAVTQMNSHQLAHAQALYNKNNDLYVDYPPEILEALGLNPNLSNGTLTNNENVNSNVVGGQTFTDDEVSHYATIIDAADNSILSNYGILDNTPPPPPVVQAPYIPPTDTGSHEKIGAGGSVGSGGH